MGVSPLGYGLAAVGSKSFPGRAHGAKSAVGGTGNTPRIGISWSLPQGHSYVRLWTVRLTWQGSTTDVSRNPQR